MTEFSIMESIGMTPRQLLLMLIKEGILYAGGCMDGYVNSGNGCDLCDLPVNELSKSPIFNPTISYFGCSSCKLLSLHRGSSSYLADLRKEWFLGSENKRN